MLPFDRTQFLDVFAAYNAALWPAVIAAYALAVIALVAGLRKANHAVSLPFWILSAMWAWTGIAYHLVHFSEINPLARAFGIAFLAQAGLFAVWAVRLSGRYVLKPTGAGAAVGYFLILYAAFLYPLIGIVLGHELAQVPMFGVTPCPLTIFTFGVLLLIAPNPPFWLFSIPVLWAFIGGSAAFLLGIPQDWMLPFSAIAALVLLRPRTRTFRAGKAV
ncbi:DUF6064 family protein [Lutibaculum baratangense]|uniref:Uncharacterized protein n=1 Tax=Lutibaculum baratangense AMV1 TaxID=631454 RepID=V4TCE6_9HYPH|nr:DUF6064 family protein [Lutibaculum baratangense]ESR23988.1 hypothetical protein N177_2757 [Lutibaculum baratangense AMV1]